MSKRLTDSNNLYATTAVVDLGAIRSNLLQVRQLVGERKIMLAVKANAYGHGSVEVSKLAQTTNLAQWLAVSTIPEGIELRKNGIELPILKLSPVFKPEISAALANAITLTVVDETTIRLVNEEAKSKNLRAGVHLGIDTGMGRTGKPGSAAKQLVKLIDRLENIELEGIFTHLPVSDGLSGIEFTKNQLGIFRQTVAEIEQYRGPIPLVHAGNSGAILNHDLEGTNLVRPGIMAYGYLPNPASPKTLELSRALTVKSRVSFIKQVPKGTSISYGRTWIAPADTWIATVPIGYADGFSRLNSNRGKMLIQGHAYPVVGRVCMDQTMLDLGVKAPEFTVGQPVTILGEDQGQEISADDLAEIMGTISYEVTCLFDSRMTKKYLI